MSLVDPGGQRHHVVFIREAGVRQEGQSQRGCDNGRGEQTDAVTGHGGQEASRRGKHQNGRPSQPPGEPALLTSGFQPLFDFWPPDSKITDLCCFKPLS